MEATIRLSEVQSRLQLSVIKRAARSVKLPHAITLQHHSTKKPRRSRQAKRRGRNREEAD
jgi:hypothetical protein